MFVITADQINSRSEADRIPEIFAALADLTDRLTLPPDRNAGDEIQFVTASAHAALDIVLRLHRDEHWSIGLGIGPVNLPLPADARAASGAAFINARAAVTAAKKSTTRFALGAHLDTRFDAEHLEALIDLLLSLRSRRTPEGWAVADLVSDGSTGVDAAERLGISPAAVSLRLRAAGWRLEERAAPALVILLEQADAEASHSGEPSDSKGVE